MSLKPHILITGASGFLGRHLIDRLKKIDVNLTQVCRVTSPKHDEDKSQIALDLRDRRMVNEVFSDLKPNFVIHLAGLKNRDTLGGDFHDLNAANVSISLNVIEACLNLKNFKRFITIGSCDEYGLAETPFDEDCCEVPVNAYGISKLAITKILSDLNNACNFPSIILRPSVIYGPNQGMDMFVPALIKSLLSRKEFLMTEGDQYRDFVYISDVVDAIKMAIFVDDQVNGSVFNIGSGSSIKIKNVAILIANLIDPSAFDYLKFGVIKYRQNEVMEYSVNITLAKNILGWRPKTNLENGLLKTISEFKSQII